MQGYRLRCQIMVLVLLYPGECFEVVFMIFCKHLMIRNSERVVVSVQVRGYFMQHEMRRQHDSSHLVPTGQTESF